MIAKRYLQFSFLLPLIVPSLILLTAKTTFAYGAIIPILTFSLFLGGLPYLLFIIGLLICTRRKDASAIQRITFIAPLLFIPVFLLCVLVFIPIQLLMIGDVTVEANVVVGCCIVILILGYIYVAVVNAGYAILKVLKFA